MASKVLELQTPLTFHAFFAIFRYINVVRERSTHTPPTEREVHWLQDLSGMDMWNVALKQHL